MEIADSIAEPGQEEDCTLIDYVTSQGGPRPSDYPALDRWAQSIHSGCRNGRLSTKVLANIRLRFGEAFSSKTLQGLAFLKPHGYAGDFEMMDRIYRESVSPEPNLRRWDIFWQSHAATKAVRNRKAYFHRLLDTLATRRKPFRVLKIAIGPGRSMFEWLSRNPDADVLFECVDSDPAAIEYAARLNAPFASRINLVCQNALRFRPRGRYDLIWSAGLFDYFNDRLFQIALRRLIPAIKPGGELVIGNFSPNNPTRCWMELSEWFLHHRSSKELIALCQTVGIPREAISIGYESLKVNLFVHIKRGLNRTGGRDVPAPATAEMG